jgi:hypothetical protein
MTHALDLDALEDPAELLHQPLSAEEKALSPSGNASDQEFCPKHYSQELRALAGKL